MKTILVILFSVTVLVPGHAQIVEMMVSDEPPLADITQFSVPHKKLTPAAPLAEIPARIIPASKYRYVKAVDSVGYVYDSITSPVAFSYKPKGEEFGQVIAIQLKKRKWVLLDWSVFSLAAPAGLKMSWIDINGVGSKEMLLTFDRTDEKSNVEQILGSWTDRYGTKYDTHSHWRHGKGFCIIDIDSMTFLVDNIYTGYEYFYELWEYVRGEEHKGPGLVYPNALNRNRQRKTFKVWYDFNIQPRTITVRLRECQTTSIIDPSINYSDQSKTDEEPRVRVLDDSATCTLMWVEGTYVLVNGKFIKQ